MSTSLTEYQIKTLKLLLEHGGYTHLSQIGYKLFEGEKENRKRNPSPQGMALAASRFVYPLGRLGYVRGVGGKYPFEITSAGIAALEALVGP